MLPVLKPHGGNEEIEALSKVIKSGWWGKGPLVKEFEEKFAKMVGAKYAVAVTSNSHGQDLVMKALDIRDGDVINPTISFMATAMIPLWQPNITTNVVDVDPSINDTYILSCFLAPTLNPCSLYGGLVAIDVYP